MGSTGKLSFSIESLLNALITSCLHINLPNVEQSYSSEGMGLGLSVSIGVHVGICLPLLREISQKRLKFVLFTHFAFRSSTLCRDRRKEWRAVRRMICTSCTMLRPLGQPSRPSRMTRDPALPLRARLSRAPSEAV